MKLFKKRRARLQAAISAALLAASGTAFALPQGGNVVNGAAAINPAGLNQLDITQSTSKAIIEWNNFNIANGETVNFNQPDVNSVTLNRLIGNGALSASQIDGALNANGNIFLVNPAGIVFGSTASVDVGGLVASTKNITNDDFLSGDYSAFNSFTTVAANPLAAVVNQGDITAATSLTLRGDIVAGAGTASAKEINLVADKYIYGTDNVSNPSSTDLGTALSVSPTQKLSVAVNDANASANVSIGSALTGTELSYSNNQLSSEKNTSFSDGVIHDIDLAFTQNAETDNFTVSSNLDVDTDKTLSLTVNANTLTNSGYAITAGTLNIENTRENGSVGFTPLQSTGDPAKPLIVDAGTVNVKTNAGNIVLAGDKGSNLTIGNIDTGNLYQYQNGIANKGQATVAVLSSTANTDSNGKFTGGGAIVGADDNLIHAGTINLLSDSDLGSTSQRLNFDTTIFSAQTNNGSIYLNNASTDQLPFINNIVAQDQYKVGDNYASGTGIPMPDGSISVGGGSLAGVHDIDITSNGDLAIFGGITATRNTTLTSTDGAVYTVPLPNSGSAARVLGKTVTINANKGIGALANTSTATAGAPTGTDDQGNTTVGTVTGTVTSGMFVSAENVTATSTTGDVHFQMTNLKGTATIAGGAGKNVGLTVSSGGATVGNIGVAGGASGTLANVNVQVTNGALFSTAGGSIAADSVTLFGRDSVGASTRSLQVDTSNLTVTASQSGISQPGDIYVNDIASLEKLSVTTTNGGVYITQPDGTLTFDQQNLNGGKTLNYVSSPPSAGFDLQFTNTAGDIDAGALNFSGQNLNLNSSMKLTANGGGANVNAEKLTLKAAQIGEQANPLSVTTGTLALTTTNGGAYVSDSFNGAANLTASIVGTNAPLWVNQTGGDLILNAINAPGAITLKTVGQLSQAGDATRINATGGITLEAANGIGGSGTGNALRIAVPTNATPVKVSANTTGQDVFLDTTGNAEFNVVATNGNIHLNHQGDATLDQVSAGGANSIADIQVKAGSINAGTPPTVGNPMIQAATLNASADNIGSPAAPIVVNVDKIIVNARTGDIYIQAQGDSSATPIKLVQGVSAGNFSLSSPDGRDIDLGVISAPSNTVTLDTQGAITDSRAAFASAGDLSATVAQQPNITADTAAITGQYSDLTLNVSNLTGELLGSSDLIPTVSISNSTILKVTASMLSNNGGKEIRITAPSIVIDNNNGTPLSIGAGTLTLNATDGNIVFLNSDDTIIAARDGNESNSGNFNFTARNSQPMVNAYNGNIIVGNLQTSNGGNIKLIADGNISIGRIDAGHEGNVDILAAQGSDHVGVILTSNNSNQDIIGNRVHLEANAPDILTVGRIDAQAGDDQNDRVSELNSVVAQLNTALQLLATFENDKSTDANDLSEQQAKVNALQAKLDDLNKKVNDADIGFSVANGVLEIAQDIVAGLQIPVGAAQAIPLVGDGGGATAAASVALALQIAQQALDEASRVLSDLEGQQATTYTDLGDAQTTLAELQRELDNDQTHIDTYTTVVNGLNQQKSIAQLQVDAGAIVRQQSRNATAMVQSVKLGTISGIDMSATKPLKVEANRLDINLAGDGDQTIPGSVYISSPGNIGLGNIQTRSVDYLNLGDHSTSTDTDPANIYVNAQGDISVAGNVSSPNLITLSANGAVHGTGGDWNSGTWQPNELQVGTLTAPQIILNAQNGIGNDSDGPVQTATHEIAIQNSGQGDISVENTNPNDDGELIVGTVDGVSGITTDGDIHLVNHGDLVLNQIIKDTDTSTDNAVVLDADGAIIDGNGSTLDANGDLTSNYANALNVVAHDLSFSATGSVDLDTQVDRIVDGKSTSQGDIDIRNVGDLNVIGLDAANGELNVITKADPNEAGSGNLQVGTLTAGSANGNDNDVFLTADGNIDDDNDNTTRISGDNLTIKAGGSVGANGAQTTRGIDTTINTLTSDAHGETNIFDSDDLQVDHVATNIGDITIGSATGSLAIGDISTTDTGKTATLWATNGSISGLDPNKDFSDTSVPADVHASNIALNAGHGIGADDRPLLTETQALEANAGDGGLYITNRGSNLQIGGVTPNLGLPALTGLNATGDLKLNNTNGDVHVIENITQHAASDGSGVADITSSGSQVYDADVNADSDTTLTAGGNIDVDAGHHVRSSAGDITLTADDGDDSTINTITLHNGSDVTAQSTLTATAGNDISLDNAQMIAQTGDLQLTATIGNLQVANNSSLEATAGALTAQAGKGILLSDSTAHSALAGNYTADTEDIILKSSGITADSGELNLTATAGNIWLTHSDTTPTIGSTVTANDGALDLEAGQDITLDSASTGQAIKGSTGTGNVKANAQGGDLQVIQASQLLADGAMDLDASDNINVDGNSDTKALGGNLTMDAAAGHINVTDHSTASASANATLTAGTDVTVNDNSGITAGDNLNITATAGDLNVTDESTLDAQNGTLTAKAGKGILLEDSNAGSALAGNYTADTEDIILKNSNITAGTGALNLIATLGNIHLTHSDTSTDGSTVTASDGALDLEAGKNITLDSASVGQAMAGTNGGTGDVKANAQGGDLQVTQASHLLADGAMDLDASDNINVDGNSSVEAQGGNLTMDAIAGYINVTDNSTASASSDAILTAGTDIDVDDNSRIIAINDATLTAGTDVTVNDNSGITAGDNLNITATAGDLNVTNESTLDATSGKLTAQAGKGILLEDSDASSALDGNYTADTEDIVLKNSNITADTGALNLIATLGSIHLTHSDISTDGSTVTASDGALDLEAGKNITLDSASIGKAIANANGSGDITANAQNGDLKVIQASQLLADGDLTATASNNATVDDHSSLIAGNNVNVTATTGDLNVTDNSTLKATNGTLTAKAGDNVDVDKSTFSADKDINVTADNGDITLTESTSTAGDNTTFTAGQGIGLSDSTITSQSGQADLHALGGGINMVPGSEIDAATDVNMDATGNIALNLVHAGEDVTLLSSGGAITAAQLNQPNITGVNLIATAANGIGADGAPVNTSVDNAQLNVTGNGDLFLNNDKTLTISQSQVVNGNADIVTGGDLHIDQLQVNGDAHIDSAGVFDTTTPNGLITAHDLNATAADGIDIHSDINSATLAVTGAGDIDVNNDGALALNSATAADGNVDVHAGGNLGVEYVSVTAGHTVALDSDGAISAIGDGTIDSPITTLTAEHGIASANAPLHLNAGLINANTTDGDIGIVQDGDTALQTATTGSGDISVILTDGSATLGNVRTGQGDVDLEAQNGSLLDDGNTSTLIGGDAVRLVASGDIGRTNAPLQTQAKTLDAQSTEQGGIVIQEADGLDQLDASTADGPINVTSTTGDIIIGTITAIGNNVMLTTPEGAIRDLTSDGPNITSDSLDISTKLGIGLVGNPLDVKVNQLSATNSNSGGVYIRNWNGIDGTNPGTDLGDITSDGDVDISNDGHIDHTGNIDAGGDVSITSDGDVNQTGDITSGGNVNISSDNGSVDHNGVIDADGNVSLSGSGDVTQTGDIIAGGNVDMSSSNGDVNQNGDVNAGGDVSVHAGGDFNQNGDINANGDILVDADGDITMAPGTSTNSPDGDISYTAGGTLTTGQISTKGGLLGGTVTLTANELGLPLLPGSITGSQVAFWLDNPLSLEQIGYLIPNPNDMLRISQNARTVGGAITLDTQWVGDVTNPVGVLPGTLSVSLDTPYKPGFQSIAPGTWSFVPDDVQ